MEIKMANTTIAIYHLYHDTMDREACLRITCDGDADTALDSFKAGHYSFVTRQTKGGCWMSNSQVSQALNVLYAATQNVDSSWVSNDPEPLHLWTHPRINRAGGCRSTSVGDIIQVRKAQYEGDELNDGDGEAVDTYMVAPVGFVRIERVRGRTAQYESHHGTPAWLANENALSIV